MIVPYPYQAECLKAVEETLSQGRKKALIVMASGLGKTITAALTFKAFCCKQPGSRLLFLCHQNDILEQASIEFRRVLGDTYTYGLFTGRDKILYHEADCLFASFQTMQRKKQQFDKDDFDVIIVDESHHTHAKTYLPTVRYFRPTFLLGITATPERSDLLDIRHVYGREIFNLDLHQAIARRLLTPVHYVLLMDEIRRSKTIKTPEGMMSIAKLNKMLFVPKRDKEIVRIIKQYQDRLDDPRTIIFCQSIEHSRRLEKLLGGALLIHNAVKPADRKQRLLQFRQSGGTIVTIDMFNEGIDVPSTNLIVFLRSTSSPRIFYQQLGRGLRKSPGKKEVTILDLVGNVERIETIHKLKQMVEAEQELLKRESTSKHKRSRYDQEPLEVETGEISFDEVIVPILHCLKFLRRTYNSVDLVEELRQMANKLGRNITVADIQEAHKKDRSAGLHLFYKNFGSIANAREAAGLDPGRRSYTESEDLTEMLKKLGKDLGRTPNANDIKRASKAGLCPSVGTYIKFFGSVGAAQSAAGFKPNPHGFDPDRAYQGWFTDENLIEYYQQLERELGRRPRQRDIQSRYRRGETPAYRSYFQHFSNFANMHRIIAEREKETERKD